VARAETAATAAVALVATNVDDIAISPSSSRGAAAAAAAFGIMRALWCVPGRIIGSHPAVVRGVERAGHVVVPVVLIALGVFTVLESGLL
jgi:cadmium resistance protein CadD (predicted permease)